MILITMENITWTIFTESSLELCQIVDRNGTQHFKGLEIPFVEDGIIQTCPFEDDLPDDEEYDCDDGIVTHYYD
jgi:hypothetical protein